MENADEPQDKCLYDEMKKSLGVIKLSFDKKIWKVPNYTYNRPTVPKPFHPYDEHVYELNDVVIIRGADGSSRWYTNKGLAPGVLRQLTRCEVSDVEWDERRREECAWAYKRPDDESLAALMAALEVDDAGTAASSSASVSDTGRPTAEKIQASAKAMQAVARKIEKTPRHACVECGKLCFLGERCCGLYAGV